MKSIALMALVIIAIGIGVIYYLNQPNSFVNTTPSASDQVFNKKIPDSSSQEKQLASGNYQQYSPQAFDNAIDKKRVLFFYANWCPICIPADKEFKANTDKIPQDIVIFRVNYNDTETDDKDLVLAHKYGIVYQHTFVQVDKDGKVITKWNGGSLDKLLSSIK